MNFQDCEKEVTNNGMYTVCLSIMWGTNVLCARNKSHNILMFMIVDAAVILILMCRNIVNVAIQIAQLL